MSALENVELPLTLVGKLNEKERRNRAIDLLTCTFQYSLSK